MSEQGFIDLYYGDESSCSSQGYVPYGWQFPDEDVHIAVEKGFKINILGFISRSNQTHYTTTEQNINSSFVQQVIHEWVQTLTKETVLVLDNASMHRSKAMQEKMKQWQEKGLFIIFLPPYSPHLNIAETWWRKLKKEWLDPQDYQTTETLNQAIQRCLHKQKININFSKFRPR